MIRLIVYIIISLVLTAALAWLISLPGSLYVEVAGYRMQPGIGAAIIAVIVLVLVAIAIWAIIRRIVEAPARLDRFTRRRRQDQGFEALSNAFIALQAGDAARARSLAIDAQSRLPGNAAAQLLEARADLALGDLRAAREHYRALISNPATALAALTGLYEQARAQGRNAAALTFARKANTLAPELTWAGDAVFDDLAARGEWSEALRMLDQRPTTGKDGKQGLRRRQAVVHTAIAAEAEPTDPPLALEHALAALKRLPDFVPAALISARIHANRGESRKAQSLLRRVWRTTGHPDVALLYVNVQPGASAVERLRRARELFETAPADAAAAAVLARAAVDAYEWSTARNALAPHVAGEPSQAVCLLMAEIEEGQYGDQGKAREWLARAVRAPRDPAWVADGIASPEWEPVSPVTGKLDAFVWTVPPGRSAARLDATTTHEANGAAPPLSETRTPALPPAGA